MKGQNQKKLKVGIAGYGIVGKRRRECMEQHPQLEVVAVSDHKYSSQGTLDDGVRFYPDYQPLIENEKLDLLFVCLPNYLAPAATIQGLEKGMHVFCEKPPGRTVEDIERVIEAEKKHPQLKLMYGFNHRYHDSIRDAFKIVRSQELGKLVNMRGMYGKSVMINFENDWRTKRDIAGGGILLDQGIHMVDLMRLFAEKDFTTVHSFVTNNFWHHDVEDNAYALMKTDSGIVAMLHSSATQWRHRFQLELALEKGMIILSGILSGTKSYGAETLTVAYRGSKDKGDPKEVTTRYNEDPSWKEEIFAFVQAVLEDRPIDSGSSMEALKTMQLVYKIYQADPKWWDICTQTTKG